MKKKRDDNLPITQATLRQILRETLSGFARKDDLSAFATKDDLHAIHADLKHFATKDDLSAFATKDDLKRFATKDDLNDIRADIAQLPTKDYVARFATNAAVVELTEKLENFEKRVDERFTDLASTIDVRFDAMYEIFTEFRAKNKKRAGATKSRLVLVESKCNLLEDRVTRLEK